MRILTIFLLFLLTFAPACNTIDQLKSENDEIANKIVVQETFRIENASGAVHATKKILEGAPENKHTSAAIKTSGLAEDALPPLSIEDRAKWDEIADKALEGSDKEVDKIRDQLINSEKKTSELKKNLEENRNGLLLLHERIRQDHESVIADLKKQTELKEKLMKYFVYAAGICVLAGGALTWLLGIKIGVNAFLAGGFFALASFLITQPVFSYIAAGMAIVMFLWTIYYIWGQLKPNKALKKQIRVIDSMEGSKDARVRDAAKMFKDEMRNTLVDPKEKKVHVDYIRKLKK